MKTIEERIEELYNTWPRMDKAAIRRTMIALAADLNAEKEREVAELKTAIQELSNSKVAGDQLNAKYIGEIAELQAWKESSLKVMPDFQKLGKLLGLPIGSSVSEQLVPAVEKLTKEVAELREKLAAIEAGSDIQSLSVSSHFELDCGPIKAEPALLDEVKRVLAWYVGNQEPDWECTCEQCRNHAAAHSLLTRLGGSHE